MFCLERVIACTWLCRAGDIVTYGQSFLSPDRELKYQDDIKPTGS